MANRFDFTAAVQTCCVCLCVCTFHFSPHKKLWETKQLQASSNKSVKIQALIYFYSPLPSVFVCLFVCLFVFAPPTSSFPPPSLLHPCPSCSASLSVYRTWLCSLRSVGPSFVFAREMEREEEEEDEDEEENRGASLGLSHHNQCCRA